MTIDPRMLSVLCVTMQVVGSDSNTVEHLTEVQHYCQNSRGQHVHDILDHINTAVQVNNFVVISLLFIVNL